MVTMRRTALVVGSFLLVTTATVSPSVAQPTAANPSDVAADFNNDGVADLAIGVPGETIGGPENEIAGAVNVLYGAGSGLSGSGAQLFSQVGGAVEFRDRFGEALAAGDFNGDGVADLAAGASGEDVGSVADAGAVSVLYGAAGGLTSAGGRLFTQVGSAAEAGDNFGSALAAGDFNNDNFADLAVGAPWEDAYSTRDAGAVSVLYGSAGGLTTSGGRLFTQDSAGVPDTAEGNDQFGSALAAGDFNNNGFADLAAGAPSDEAGGAVIVLPGSAGGLTTSGARLFRQVGGAVEGGDNFGFALAAGDFNNNGFADLAAGAPFETVGSTTYSAGAVSVLYGSAGGLTGSGGRLFTQVGGAVERGDLFGWAVAAGDFNNDGFVDLTAGAPWEAVGSLSQAGAISVLYGSAGGLTGSGGRLFTQVGGLVEAYDHFGSQLAAGDFNNNNSADLAAAAPSEDVGSVMWAGAVSVLQGSASGLTSSGGRLFTQDSPGVPDVAEMFDHFGGTDYIAG
jgi:hypothetical protein